MADRPDPTHDIGDFIEETVYPILIEKGKLLFFAAMPAWVAGPIIGPLIGLVFNVVGKYIVKALDEAGDMVAMAIKNAVDRKAMDLQGVKLKLMAREMPITDPRWLEEKRKFHEKFSALARFNLNM